MNAFDLGRTRFGPGLHVLQAAAGTGKTWALAHLAPRFLLDGTVEGLEQLLLVSFTEDSTRELAERARLQVGLLAALLERAGREAGPDLDRRVAWARSAAQSRGEAGLAQVLDVLTEEPDPNERARRVGRLLSARLGLETLAVATIHGFCRRVLTEEGFLCGTPPGFRLLPDASDLMDAALRDARRGRLAGDPLLARVALWDGWTLGREAGAWSLLRPLAGGRLEPGPLDLDAARLALVRALGGLAKRAPDLDAVEALRARSGFVWNKPARDLDVPVLRRALEALDPERPEAAVLDALEGLAQALDGKGGWLSATAQGRKANSEARAALERLGLFAAAAAGVRALRDLRWAWLGFALKDARARLDRSLDAAHALTYDDLVARLWGALRSPAGPLLAQRLRARWKVALVDECQDTDRRQLDIFTRVFRAPEAVEQRLVLVGDPAQSIYRFRGGDLSAYLDLRDQAGPDRVHRLTATYRAPGGLVEALHSLWPERAPLGSPRLALERPEARRADAELPLPEGERFRVKALLVGEAHAEAWGPAQARLERACEAAARAVAGLLGRPLGGGVVDAGRCAVLVRDNRQAKAAREALAARGVPAVVRDDADVLEGETAAELALLLWAVARPQAPGRLRLALATRLLGLDSAELDALDPGEEERWRERFAAWGGTWERDGIAACLGRIEREAGVPARLAGPPQAERLLTDWRHLWELLQAEEGARRLEPERLLAWLDGARAGGEGEQPPDARLRRLETDARAVQISTVHRAKGLEYDFVFCPFLWHRPKERLKDGFRLATSPDGRERFLSPAGEEGESEAGAPAAAWEDLEEELRLLYVALTRARRQVWFLAGWIGYAPGASCVPPSPLDWILRSDDEGGESREDWYERMAIQKRPFTRAEEGRRSIPFLCGHGERLRRLPLIGVSDWAPSPPTPAPAPEAPAAPLAAEAFTRAVPGAWDVGSFTRLVGGHDAPRERGDFAREAAGSGVGPERPVPLARFPKGAEAGECLHELLQHWDFRSPVEGLVDRTLQRHGLPPEGGAGRDAAGLLKAALPAWGGSLACHRAPLERAASRADLSEWHFLLPLAGRGLDGAVLAGIFALHPDPRIQAYAPGLKGLGSEAVHGFLQGYVDRFIEVEGRWGVADWKSNHLGDLPSDYAPERLLEASSQAHYVLQVFLYLVALRRHLRLNRVSDPLAGADLVFLRGLDGRTGRGILHFEAPEDFLERLDALFVPGLL